MAIALQTGCANRATSTSYEGRVYCKQNHPVVPFSSREEQARTEFQRCLATIDQELTKNREQLTEKAKTDERARQAKLLQQQRELESPEPRLFYCRVHMQDVINAENERVRLLPARVRAYKDPSLTEAERAANVEAYNAAETKLAKLIPQRYRGNMELIPTAVSIFSTCDLKDFSKPGQ